MHSENKPIKRIGIVIFDYIFACSPLIINSALILESEGNEIHIFVNKDTYENGKIHFDDKNIVVHSIDSGLDYNVGKAATSLDKLQIVFSRNGRLRGLNLYQPPIKNLYVRTVALYKGLYYIHYRLFRKKGSTRETLRQDTAAFFPGLFEFYQKVAPYIDETYTCLLAMDVKGLIAATLIVESYSLEKRLPIIYYSLELLSEAYMPTPQDKVLQALERSCAQSCYFVVIQDEKRGAYFCHDTHVPRERLVYVPVSGLREEYRGRSNYFRDLFDISPEKKILLHAGAIADWAMCLELVKAANDWGDNLVLILHSPNLWPDSDYLDKVQRVAHDKKVYISLSPVAWDDLPSMLSSADIGLLFYVNENPNLREIGRSSNKLVQYLQAGLPVIAVDFPSLRDAINEYHCGEVASSPDQIEVLAYKILTEYDTYRNNSFECYAERYRIFPYFNTVLEKIRQIE